MFKNLSEAQGKPPIPQPRLGEVGEGGSRDLLKKDDDTGASKTKSPCSSTTIRIETTRAAMSFGYSTSSPSDVDDLIKMAIS